MSTNVSELTYSLNSQKQMEAGYFRLGYRPELDGIRGISVLLVFVHHLYYKLLPGGFLGVDIFFVLSGFLITSILIEEWNHYGSINLKNFYIRRCLRLMPAVFFLVLTLNVYALFTNEKNAAAIYQGSWLTLSYISNWLYAFHFFSAMNPFGVTWSLAIEEQFYLIYPIILSIILKAKIKRRTILVSLISAIVVIALYRRILWDLGVDATRLYYASDTRADALLIGCLAGFLISWNILPSSIRVVSYLKLFTVLGVILLILMIANLDSSDSILYQQFGYTLVAISAALILVCLIKHPTKIILKILQFMPLVWIGQVSYGLYLWHWSVRYFVYQDQVLIPSFAHLILAIVLSFAFTIFSYYLVERPFLNLKKRFITSNQNHLIKS